VTSSGGGGGGAGAGAGAGASRVNDGGLAIMKIQFFRKAVMHELYDYRKQLSDFDKFHRRSEHRHSFTQHHVLYHEQNKRISGTIGMSYI
jgi:hypothetical protein